MESRLALALALSLAILVGFQVLFPPQKREPQQPADVASQQISPQGNAGAPAASPATEPASTEPGTVVEVKSDLYRASFQPRGGRIVGFELTRYQKDPAPGDGPYDLIRASSPAFAPLAVLWESQPANVVDDRTVLYEITTSAREVREGQPVTVTMKGTTQSGASITKILELRPDSYLMDYRIVTEGLPPSSPIGVGWSRALPPKNGYTVVEGSVGYFDNKLHSIDVSSLEETEVVSGKASWAGYAEHYFLAAYVPEVREQRKLIASASDGSGHSSLWTNGPAAAVHYGLYLGPKSFEDLEAAGSDLVQAVDLGWFWFVAKPLLIGLRMIHAAVGNYGWAIVLLTIAVRLLFYPVNKRQIEAMKGMQRIAPEVKKIQEKYADDREKMNLEMMELYRRHKVNPLSGCLPMLVQLPVFIGLYNVLMQSIELRHAPFFGWMHDLSQPDRLGSLHIPFVEPAGIPVLTLLMGASMILQQKMTPSAADPVQQRMMMIMPVVFTVMFVNFPAGLVLYWLSNNILSIGQQWLSDREGR